MSIPQHNSKLYFFDYPIVDAKAIANSALRFLYYGSPHGAFGQHTLDDIPETRDLSKFDAFKISLAHLSNDPLSDDYEYNLVYLDRNVADDLWLCNKRTSNPELRKITRRVQLSSSASLKAKRFKTPFWVRFQRPIYLSIFEINVGDDNYVPPDYRQEFLMKYTGFLTRTEKGYPLVRTVFDANGLAMATRQEVNDRLDGHLQVMSYRTENQISPAASH